MSEYVIDNVNIYDTETIIPDCFIIIPKNGQGFTYVPHEMLRSSLYNQKTEEFEFVEHCDVVVWSNSVTGKTSAGWYRRNKDDEKTN